MLGVAVSDGEGVCVVVGDGEEGGVFVGDSVGFGVLLLLGLTVLDGLTVGV